MSAWQTTFDANYGLYQSQAVPVPNGGAPGSLPSASTTVKKPEKIMIQAHPDNDGVVYVGQDAALANDGSKGGFALAAGMMQVLPDNAIAVWKTIASAAGARLLVTYLSGPK